MASRRNRRRMSQNHVSYLNFANELESTSSSENGEISSGFVKRLAQNISTQDDSDEPSTPHDNETDSTMWSFSAVSHDISTQDECCDGPSTPCDIDTDSPVLSPFSESDGLDESCDTSSSVSSMISSCDEEANHSDASNEPDNNDEAPDRSLRGQLASWQVENHIPHIQCDKLLRILKRFHPELPKSTRILVQSDQNKVQLLEVPPGRYKHFGIEKGLLEAFKLLGVGRMAITSPLSIFVGIDDLKLHNSSTSQFTAIVGFIPSLQESPPFEIGVFHAHSKADNSNVLLANFITEALRLYNFGFDYNGENVKVKISALICDAPARATVTCTKGHSSDLHSCTKCTGSGVNVGTLRTNRSFRNKECEAHHHQRSIVEDLPYFDMIKDIPLDPMHLFDIGIMRRLISFLFGTKKGRNIRGVTLPKITQDRIDAFLISLRKFISRMDFARQQKSIKQLCRWKASELRLFLHYIGVVVLKPYLPKAFYDHFLCLHVAVKLLSFEEWCRNDNQQANYLLTGFVRQSERLYSKNFLCYSTHALLHVADDVTRFGPLYSYSAYRFENHYGLMKKYLPVESENSPSSCNMIRQGLRCLTAHRE